MRSSLILLVFLPCLNAQTACNDTPGANNNPCTDPGTVCVRAAAPGNDGVCVPFAAGGGGGAPGADGPPGPPGPEGPEGPVGPVGPQGLQGSDGQGILDLFNLGNLGDAAIGMLLTSGLLLGAVLIGGVLLGLATIDKGGFGYGYEGHYDSHGGYDHLLRRLGDYDEMVKNIYDDKKNEWATESH